MRVGIELFDLMPGTNQGINVYSENLAKGLIKIKKNIKIQIYVNQKYYAYAKKKFKSKNVKIIIYKNNFYKIKKVILHSVIFFNSFKIFNLQKIYKFFKNLFFLDFKNLIENNSDILICPNVILNQYNLNINTLLCIHDIQHEYLPENFSKIQLSERLLTRKLSADNCTKLIVSSLYLGRQCKKYLNIKKEKISVIEEGVDLDLFAPNKKKREISHLNLPSKYLFYPAAFWPHKNHLFLLRAINNLKKKKLNVNMIFCGLKKNSFKKVDNFINVNKLSNVKYVGNLSNYELASVYKRSTGVIIPSLEESSCLLIKEGIGFKKPIICSDTQTFKEKSRAFKIFLFKKKNITDLQKNIINIYFKKQIKKKYLVNNYKLLKRYEWSFVAEKFFDICKKLN